MKFAILGPRNGVVAVRDIEPPQQEGSPSRSFVEISDELAATILADMQAETKVFYSYENGEVITQQQSMETRQRLEAQRRMEERQLRAQQKQQERLDAMPLSHKIELGESYVEKQGFGAARLVTCMDLLLQAKESGTLAQKPKLTATYQWLQTVKGTALAGSISFQPSPHTFEEVISE